MNNSTGNPTVLVPLVTARDPTTGVETIEWHHVVEAVKFPNASGIATYGQFSVAATDPEDPGSVPSAASFTPGVVALRIYCPVQTPMVGFDNPNQVKGTVPIPNSEYQIEADDTAVADPGLPADYTPLVAPNSGHGTTEGGEYGMGSFYFSTTYQGRPATIVRPFRKVVVAQGVYRREVFGP